MPDDITARITIAVSNANAEQQCREVEDALSKVTQARREDLSVAEKSTAQTTEQSAASSRQLRIEKELARLRAEEAAKNKGQSNSHGNAHIAGESAAEARRRLGMVELTAEKENELHRKRMLQIDEENRRFEQQLELKNRSNANQGNKKDEIEAEKFAAEKAMYAREKTEAEAMDVIAKRSLMSQEANNRELRDVEAIIAKRKLLNSIQKEQGLQKKLDAAQRNLDTETAKGDRGSDPRRVQALNNALEQYNEQLIQAKRQTLQAEREYKRATQSQKNLGTGTKKMAQQAKQADREMRAQFKGFVQEGVRGLRGFTGMLGSSMGFEVSPENFTRGGAVKAAAAGTFVAGALLNLGVKSWELYKQERQEESDFRIEQLNNLSAHTDQLLQESEKRQSLIATLGEFSEKEQLTNLERVKQSEMLRKLSRSFGDLKVEVDGASGRIKNFGVVEEKGIETEARAQMADISREQTQIRTEMLNHERFLEKANMLTSVADKEGIIYARQALDKLYARSNELILRYNKAQRQITPEAQQQRWLEREARVKDKVDVLEAQRWEAAISNNKMRSLYRHGFDLSAENELRDKNALLDQEWQKKEKERLEKEVKESHRAAMETQAGTKERYLAMQKHQDVFAQYVQILKNSSETERYLLERKRENVRISQEINDMAVKNTIQRYKNEKNNKKAEEIAMALEIQRKRRAGWNENQIKRYHEQLKSAQMLAKAEDKKRKAEARDQRFSRLYQLGATQYRQTSQGAIMSDSIEALRLQSRMLVRNTPQQQLLDINKQQYKVQQQIAQNTRGGVNLRVVSA